MQRRANELRLRVEKETSEIKDFADPNFVAPFTISIGIGYTDPRYTLEENIKVAKTTIKETERF